MPRIHPRTGALAMGIAGGPASIDGRAIATIGGGCQWLDDETLIFGAPEGVCAHHVPTHKQRVLDPRSPNGLAAGGGQWIAFRTDVGVYGSLNNPVASLARSANGVGAAAPDGTLAINPIYQSAGGLQLHDPAGRVRDITGSVFWDPHVVSFAEVIWDGLDGRCDVDGIAPAPSQFGDLGLRFRYVHTPNGPWLVYSSRRWGVVARPAESREGVILADVPGAVIGRMFYHDAAWIEGLGLLVAWSTGAGELPHEWFRVPHVETMPRVDLTPPIEVALTPINREMWIGFFAGAPGATGGWDTNDDPPGTQDPHALPGNGYLSVPQATFFDKHDRPIGTWITDGSVEAIEAQARTALHTPIAYWDDRSWPRWPNLPDGSWLSIQAYPKEHESLDHIEQDVSAILDTLQRTRPAQRVALVPRVSSPFGLDARALVAMASRLGARFPNVYAMTPFSGNGRATGLQHHPEVWPLWEQLVHSIPGPPIVTVPPPPVPPKEPPVPSPVSLDTWIHVEYPQLVEAYRAAFGSDPNTEWAAFQSARRGVQVPEGRWPFAKMLAHEQGREITAPPDQLPTLDGWIHGEFPQLVEAYRQTQGSEPGHEWAAFQTARRGIVVPEGAWSFEKMLAHERAQGGGTPTPQPPAPTPTPTQPPASLWWIKRSGTDVYFSLDADRYLVGGKRRQAFETRDLGGGKVALVANGKIGATENDGRVKFTRDHVDSEWDRFLEERHGDAVSFRTDRAGHQLISVDDQGNIRVNQSAIGSWETLTLEAATGASVGGEVGQLTLAGRRLLTADGTPWFGVGLTWFTGLQDWIVNRGKAEAFLDRAVNRPNPPQWVRPFGMYNGGIGRFIPSEYPNYFDAWRELGEALAGRGLRFEPVVFADCKDDATWPLHFDPAFFDRVNDALAGLWNIFPSGGNEMPFNGFDAGRLRKPSGALSIRCSMGTDALPFHPPWDIVAFETSRNDDFERAYKSVWDLYNGQTGEVSVTFERPVLIDEMIGIGEVNEPGRTTADPFKCWQLAAGAKLMGAVGICAHIRTGITGDFPAPGSLAEQCVDAMSAAGRLPLGAHAFGRYERGLSPGEGQNSNLPIIHNDRDLGENVPQNPAGTWRTHAMIEGNSAEVIAPGPGDQYHAQPANGWRIVESFTYGREPNVFRCER